MLRTDAPRIAASRKLDRIAPPADVQRLVFLPGRSQAAHRCWKRTRKTEDVAFTRCLWADFDGLADVDPDEAAAKVLASIAGAGLPHPTIVTHSGRGVHAFWRLNEPLPADRIAAHHRAIHPLIGSDNVGDPTRPMRMPGTANYKCDPPRPCRVLPNDAVWTLNDFPRPDERAESTERDDADPADADEVPRLLARLSADRCDDYHSWIKVGMACKTVSTQTGVDLFDAWHEWSRTSPNYGSESQCRRKWNSFPSESELRFGSLDHWVKEDDPR